jgi:type VI secretion system protein VasJ
VSAAPLSTVFIAPLSGTALPESEFTYRPGYELLSTEIEKARSPNAVTTDWRLVLAEGTRLLQEEGKDLRVAAWVVVASAHVTGWAGALDGVTALAALVEGSWDTMFPARPRGRIASIEWLWDSLGRALRGRPAAPGDRATLEALLEGAGRVDALLTERLKEQVDGLGAFRKIVRERIASVPEVAAPPPRAPSPPPPASHESASQESPARWTPTPSAALPPPPAPKIDVPVVASAASLEELDRLAGPLRDGLRSFAGYERQVAPTSPRGYRLARVSVWFNIEEAPQVERGRATIRGPAASDRTALERLAADGDWSDLLESSEGAFAEHMFWLDLHRYSALALENLGASYAAARATVVRELVSFLERVPGIERLQFATGTPFASPECLGWLDRERAKGGGGAPAASDGASPADRAFEELVEAARARLGSDGETALGEVLTAANAPRSAPAQFLAKLGAARFALDAGRRETALLLFEQLFEQVDDTLEAWQPGACRRVFEGYLDALGEPEEGATQGGRQTAVFRRLLRVDPALVLRYAPGKK